MSLSSTLTRLSTVVDGVSGVGNVRVYFGTPSVRADAEALLVAGGKVNSWEFAIKPSAVHGGASGMNRIVASVSGEALYEHKEGSDSFNTFVALLEAVLAALIAPVTGFPQVTEAGVRLVELQPTPTVTRAGHSCYRARIEFDLSDVDNT